MDQLKIGMVGLFHGVARGDMEAFARATKELKAFGQEQGFSVYVAQQKVYNYEDSEAAVRELNAQQLDFTLVFSASLIVGDAVIPLAGLHSKIGLWAVPEDTSQGYMARNSFCSTMIVSGMLGKYFTNHSIPFKWFYGYTGYELFRERMLVTLGALRAIKMLAGSRIATIGPMVKGFDYIMANEGNIRSLYGTRINRQHSVEELVTLAQAIPPAAAKEEMAAIQSEGRQEVDNAALERFARLYLALRNLAEQGGYNALAVSCWTRLNEVYGAVPCAALSRLNQHGVVATCECDVDGTIGMLIDKAINGVPSSIVDIVNVDPNENSIMLWHCGPSPACMANEEGVSWASHHDIGEFCNGEWQGSGVVANLHYRPGRVTLHRINSNTGKLFALEGELTTREVCRGAGGWMRGFTMQGQALDAKTLMNTMYHCRLDHHVAFGYGSIEAQLLEFAHWLGLDVTPPQPYTTYL